MTALPVASGSEPVAGEAPQVAPVVPAQPVGTAVAPVAAVQADPGQPSVPQVEVDWQAQAEASKAEADKLKGFQALYTRGKQSGVWDGVEGFLEGASPEEAKAKWERLQQGETLLTETEKMGGWDRIKTDFNLLNDPSATEPNPAEPGAPAQGQEELLRRLGELEQGLDTRVTKALETRLGQLDIAATKDDVVLTIAKEYGLATDGQAVNPYTLKLVRGAMNSDLEEVTGGLRDPEPEEVGAAGRRVAEALFAPLRASGAALTNPQPTPAMPPGTNGRQPSGAQPAKPPAQFNRQEQDEAAKTMAREMIQPTIDAQPPAPELPPGHSFQ